MTSRAKVLVLALLLTVLALLLVRQRMVRATSPEALEARFNQVEDGDAGLYRLEIGATRLGLTGGTFTALEVTVLPDSATLARLTDAGSVARTRYAVTIPRIEVTGINRRAMLGGHFDAQDVVLHGLDLRVWLDRHIQEGASGGPVPLPHERLLAAGAEIIVGRASIEDGRFRYFERSRDGARFGLLEFDSLQVSAAAITNRTTGGLEAGIVPIELAGRLGGTAPISTHMLYNVRTPGFNLVVNGGLGPTDARLLNQLMMDLEGMRITKGVVDSIAWEFEVEDGVAGGRMVALYRDLAIERLDKVTRTQDLGDEIVSFFGNNFKLNQSNPASPGAPALVVPLAHRRGEREPFFRFLWLTLRGGLLQTAGL